MMKGSEFSQLQAFAVVAACCSFRKAATQLGLAPSTLSQTISTLEDRLDVRLFNRTTRSVRLTTAGELLLERLSPLLKELDHSVAEVSHLANRAAGHVRIVSSRAGARLALAPLVARFCPRHPHIDLAITVDDTITNIVEREFDAGVRVGNLLEKDMIALPLTPAQKISIVASPAYLATQGHPSTPKDLREHNCVRTAHPTTGVVFPWRFRVGKQTSEFLPAGNLTLDDDSLVLDCLLSGAGIGYMLDADVRDHVRSGALVQLLPGTADPLPGFHIYYVRTRHMSRALRLFIDFIKAERDW